MAEVTITLSAYEASVLRDLTRHGRRIDELPFGSQTPAFSYACLRIARKLVLAQGGEAVWLEREVVSAPE